MDYILNLIPSSIYVSFPTIANALMTPLCNFPMHKFPFYGFRPERRGFSIYLACHGKINCMSPFFFLRFLLARREAHKSLFPKKIDDTITWIYIIKHITFLIIDPWRAIFAWLVYAKQVKDKHLYKYIIYLHIYIHV